MPTSPPTEPRGCWASAAWPSCRRAAPCSEAAHRHRLHGDDRRPSRWRGGRGRHRRATVRGGRDRHAAGALRRGRRGARRRDARAGAGDARHPAGPGRDSRPARGRWAWLPRGCDGDERRARRCRDRLDRPGRNAGDRGRAARRSARRRGRAHPDRDPRGDRREHRRSRGRARGRRRRAARERGPRAPRGPCPGRRRAACARPDRRPRRVRHAAFAADLRHRGAPVGRPSARQSHDVAARQRGDRVHPQRERTSPAPDRPARGRQPARAARRRAHAPSASGFRTPRRSTSSASGPGTGFQSPRMAPRSSPAAGSARRQSGGSRTWSPRR